MPKETCKAAVIERHHRTGNVGLGFVQGLGLKRGAIASSVAHDSHNLILAGMNDMDMFVTAQIHLINWWRPEQTVTDNEQVTARLPLPVAGLMSDQTIKSVISNLTAVNRALRPCFTKERLNVRVCIDSTVSLY